MEVLSLGPRRFEDPVDGGSVPGSWTKPTQVNPLSFLTLLLGDDVPGNTVPRRCLVTRPVSDSWRVSLFRTRQPHLGRLDVGGLSSRHGVEVHLVPSGRHEGNLYSRPTGPHRRSTLTQRHLYLLGQCLHVRTHPWFTPPIPSSTPKDHSHLPPLSSKAEVGDSVRNGDRTERGRTHLSPEGLVHPIIDFH